MSRSDEYMLPSIESAHEDAHNQTLKPYSIRMRHDGYDEPVLQVNMQQRGRCSQNDPSDDQRDDDMIFVESQRRLNLPALISWSHKRVDNNTGITPASHLSVAGITVNFSGVILHSSKLDILLFTDM